MSNDKSDANVIPFPRQLRVVPIEQDIAVEAYVITATVEHDGRTYELESLLQQLPPHCFQEAVATVPRSGQELWDEIVRRWPGTAAEIAAGVAPVDE
jgi:hypothetical protein